MIRDALNTKVFQSIYRVVLPAIVVSLLLGIASINFSKRTLILSSVTFDFVIRVLLSVWFSTLYIRLSRFSTYSVYPNRHWTAADVGRLEKYYLMALSVLFSLACGILTFWVVQSFFINAASFALGIALINCVIVLLPMITQYWVLKL